MNVDQYSYAVKLDTKKGPIAVEKANGGGYLPEKSTDIREMVDLIIERKMPVSRYSLWLTDEGDYERFGIKTTLSKAGYKVPAADITPAQFKKVAEALPDLFIGLCKRPFPNPKLIMYTKGKAPAKAKASKADSTRIGR